MERFKRVKFILKDKDIEKIMIPLEEEEISIEKFSKVRVDFNLKEILTPKQKEVLAPSLNNGYYDFPKRISLNALSKKIGLSPSTLCVHLQKIESKVLNSNYADFLF
jgi:predicted DNA binding protein